MQSFESSDASKVPKLPHLRNFERQNLRNSRNSRKPTQVVGEPQAFRPEKARLWAEPPGIPEHPPPDSGKFANSERSRPKSRPKSRPTFNLRKPQNFRNFEARNGEITEPQKLANTNAGSWRNPSISAREGDWGPTPAGIPATPPPGSGDARIPTASNRGASRDGLSKRRKLRNFRNVKTAIFRKSETSTLPKLATADPGSWRSPPPKKAHLGGPRCPARPRRTQ